MSNFQFVQAEFKPLYVPTRGAEQLVHSDPRACCMPRGHALEQAGIGCTRMTSRCGCRTTTASGCC